MIIVVTRLVLKNPLKIIPFFMLTNRVNRQVNTSPGLKSFQAGAGGLLVYWTITAWNGPEEMRAFRNSGAHAEAMRAYGGLAKYGHTLVLEQDSVPGWIEVRERVVNEGRLAKGN